MGCRLNRPGEAGVIREGFLQEARIKPGLKSSLKHPTQTRHMRKKERTKLGEGQW